jgi:hypothetical protein
VSRRVTKNISYNLKPFYCRRRRAVKTREAIRRDSNKDKPTFNRRNEEKWMHTYYYLQEDIDDEWEDNKKFDLFIGFNMNLKFEM